MLDFQQNAFRQVRKIHLSGAWTSLQKTVPRKHNGYLCVAIIYDHRMWSSYVVIRIVHHICWSYIIIYLYSGLQSNTCRPDLSFSVNVHGPGLNSNLHAWPVTHGSSGTAPLELPDKSQHLGNTMGISYSHLVWHDRQIHFRVFR